MDIWHDISNILVEEKQPKQSIPLTSAITAYLLRKAISDDPGLQKEADILRRLLDPLYSNEDTAKVFQGFHLFTPHVPGEIKDRYEALKKEINHENPDILIIGACGLSPLGLVHSAENPGAWVFDTDLEALIRTRGSIDIPAPENYHLQTLDLLDKRAVAEFGDRLRKHASEHGSKSLGVVAEGLTFYLDDKERDILNRNLHLLAERSGLASDTKYFFDYFTWPVSSKKRDFIQNKEHPLWDNFMRLVKSISSGQKCFIATPKDVVKYLTTQNFINARHSRYCSKGIAHNIYVCEHKNGKQD